MLQASLVEIRPIFQLIVIQEVVNWFEQPHMVVEMFVNYDMDRKFVSHWNVFSYLVRTICAIGKRLTLVTRSRTALTWQPPNVLLLLLLSKGVGVEGRGGQQCAGRGAEGGRDHSRRASRGAG